MSWEAQAQDIVTGDSIVEELEVLYEVWAELDWRLPDIRAKTLVRSTCGVFYHAQMAFDGYPGWPQVFGVKSMPAHLTRRPPPPSFALARGNAF